MKKLRLFCASITLICALSPSVFAGDIECGLAETANEKATTTGLTSEEQNATIRYIIDTLLVVLQSLPVGV
jgi:hypothetical protein